MRDRGLRGVVRGAKAQTTGSADVIPFPLDRVNRNFEVTRPNALWVSDLTDVAT